MLLASILFVGFFTLSSFGDSATMQTIGSDIAPITSEVEWELKVSPTINKSDLNLESEVVNIYTYSDDDFAGPPGMKAAYATIEAVFYIKNYGKEQDSILGFPAVLEGSKPGPFGDFSAYINGAKVEHDYTGKLIASPYLEWAVLKTHFKPNETKTISVKHTIYVTGYAAGTLIYVLKTGALWKDNIKSAVINVDMNQPFSKERLISVSPEGYAISNNVLTWKYHNIKPTEDIKIHYIHDYAYHEHERLVNEIQKDPQLYTNHYNLALFYRDYRDYPNAAEKEFNELEETIRLNPSFPMACLVAATDYSAQGYDMLWGNPYNKKALVPLKKSIEHWKQYFSLSPDDKRSDLNDQYKRTLQIYNKIKNYKGEFIK